MNKSSAIAEMAVAEYVNSVISSSAKSVRVLRLLRAHSMTNAQVHIGYRAVVIAKLTYADMRFAGICGSRASCL